MHVQTTGRLRLLLMPRSPAELEDLAATRLAEALGRRIMTSADPASCDGPGHPKLAEAAVTVATMTEPRALITRRYSRVKGLRARGILSPATPPCEIDGCGNRSPLPGFRGPGTGYVYEHCHEHDYIRGVTCGPCNVQMRLMDAHIDICASSPRFGAYLAWWQRCPACAAGQSWEPWLTAGEYHDGPMLAELATLAHTEPGSADRAQAMALLALHGRAIIDRRRRRAYQAKRASAHAALARLRASLA